MRELILKRIEELRQTEKGFSKEYMRWKNFTIGYTKTHISEFDFNSCDDEELLSLFERIMRVIYKQS